ncbi:hypothetical protein MOB40_06895 [Bacillus inaquosorum]|uniref:Uncharacterized protein n=1 Tax=Bacillus inaquosorum TaxID=483913 RepID=A0A9Q4EPH4_9BACI|nr:MULTISPECIES: hypothetical protein [Bacillus]MCY7764865.1 hypothetical protein [Bacillus inaquosorum]MCY7787369.1 hypothetical protein [Bacillus inaquosorum]MCY7904642.1 hypothetical protein [Bacillus inaquosorum]MCY7909664.1 hypothetical protein [Bacillus inaquosorum]MCY7931342.1 hypothetical protein [Bacillus inaquosorum]
MKYDAEHMNDPAWILIDRSKSVHYIAECELHHHKRNISLETNCFGSGSVLL